MPYESSSTRPLSDDVFQAQAVGLRTTATLPPRLRAHAVSCLVGTQPG